MGPAAPLRWYRRPRRVVAVAVGLVAVAGLVVCLATPVPSALLIRALFTQGAEDTVAEMVPYAPDSGITERLDIPYGGSDGVTLDLYTPDNVAGPLPVVMWVHGGAWISGRSDDVAPYLRILASYGYVAVGVDYSISPGARYPDALTQVNTALGYVAANADPLGIDADRIVLAGDSAGAQLASQVAALTTNPSYAADLGIVPAVASYQIQGVILNCGVYDLDAMAELEGLAGWGFSTALWAYTGSREWAETPAGTQMSTIHYVTSGFPETFITGGNADGLTAHQSIPFAEKLRALGVPTTAIFFAEDLKPGLPHEYQFHLDSAEAQATLARTVDFLDRVTA